MPDIIVSAGWHSILIQAMDEAAKLPPEWCFEIVSAERATDGSLRLDAQYNAFDVPLDDHLPPERKLPHPYRAFKRIREAARAKSLVTCEVCGRPGKLVGADLEARVRCDVHAAVVDEDQSNGNPVGFLFESAEEAMANVLKDYGDGLDMMQGLHSADKDAEDDVETRH